MKIRADVDFYQLLGVLPTTDDRAIKSRFRRLAAIYHPDKLPQSSNGDGSEAFFLQLKLAQDTLIDPVKRLVYDRFGRQVVERTKAKSIRELFYGGLLALLPQYFSGLVVMLALNKFWFSSWGRYVRFRQPPSLMSTPGSLTVHISGASMFLWPSSPSSSPFLHIRQASSCLLTTSRSGSPRPSISKPTTFCRTRSCLSLAEYRWR